MYNPLGTMLLITGVILFTVGVVLIAVAPFKVRTAKQALFTLIGYPMFLLGMWILLA